VGEAVRSSVVIAAILFAGSLLAGLGFCALLPLFEGFDESAHYSYIQQIAQTGTWPRLNDPMSAEMDDYLKLAPTPMGGRWSYWAFFQAPAATQDAGGAAIHDARDPARPWRAGARPNWQGQHPPLYYAVLAPVWLVSKSWSLYTQLFLLRAVSYLLAWGGLVIAMVSIARQSAASPLKPVLLVGPALWPALFPMWFPEMARLGNDSLLLLLLALAWVVTQKALASRGRTRDFALLGALCGLSLLTKATALPFVGALGLFLIWRTWRARGDAALRRMTLSQLLVFCLTAAVVGGWWYVKCYIDYGTPLVTAAGFALAEQGGLLKGLSEHFAWLKAIIGLAENVRSFVWSGTWSFIFLPRIFEIPLSILVVVVAAGWIRQCAEAKKISSIDALALLTLGLFVLALVQNTIVIIALVGGFLAGAWYLHCLAPLLATFVVTGLDEAATWRRVRPLIGALVIYPLLFLPFVTAFHLFYFSGCLPEAIGDRRFGLTAIAACAALPREVLNHMSVLGNPAFAIPLFGAGCAVMLAGLLLFAVPRFFLAMRPSVSG
jgi:hypothetical protein